MAIETTPLRIVKPEKSTNVVGALREALEAAERGELLSVAIVGQCSTGSECYFDSAADEADLFKLLGMLAYQQSRLATRALIKNGEVGAP